MVRNTAKAAEWSARGVELVQGDWNDPASVASALQGVEGAYLMMPPIFTPSPDFREAKAVVGSFTEALKQARPPRLVLLSSIGSEKQEKLGLITSTHLMEEALSDLPFPTALLRAGGFYENYAASLPVAAQTGTLYSFYAPTDRQLPMIATEDIGREAAKLLLEGWTGKKIVELGSMQSPDQIAAAMSEVLGKPVTAQAVPRDRWVATLSSAGMPEGSTGAFEQMVDSFNSGWISFGNPGTERVEGTLTAADVLRKQHVA